MKVVHRPRLAHRRLQTVLAIAALGTAVALPVVLLSVGGGVFAHELAALRDSGYQIAVSASGEHGVDGAHSLAQKITGVPGVSEVSPILSLSLQALTPSGNSPALAEGIIPAPFSATQGPNVAGLFPAPLPLGDPTDSMHWNGGNYDGPSAGRVLVSTPFAAAQHLRVGDPLTLGLSTNRSLAATFTVSGTFGVPESALLPTAVFGVLLPLSDLQQLSGLGKPPGAPAIDAADTLQIGLTPSAARDPGEVSRVATAIGDLVPLYSVSIVSNEATQLQNSQAVLTGFYLGLSAVGLIVGLSFLGLVLVREVEMERRSIGIRRALGVPSGSIIRGILARGYFLALSGAVTGLALGICLVLALARWGAGDVGVVARLAVFDPATLGLLVAGVVVLSGGAAAVASRVALSRSIPEGLR